MNFLLALFTLIVSSSSAFALSSGQPFPITPDPRLTPGSLCARPDSKRYPEGIAYCERKVRSELKVEIMKTYDQRLGYRITQMNRNLFKIDHYIPLCMGGGNEAENLWPQHASVYQYTDPLEEAACTKMAEGRLRQRDAVNIIRQAKADPRRAPALIEAVRGL